MKLGRAFGVVGLVIGVLAAIAWGQSQPPNIDTTIRPVYIVNSLGPDYDTTVRQVLLVGPNGQPTSIAAGTLQFTDRSLPITSATAPSQCLQTNAANTGVVLGACGGASAYPAGSPPQIGGFSALNVSEAETVGGDLTFARTGPNAYSGTVLRTNGVLFSTLATAPPPLAVNLGGTGYNASAPAVGNIPVALNATTYVPRQITGDGSITVAGVLTVASTAGNAFGPLATTNPPLAVSLGGLGAGAAPTPGQILIGQSATQYLPATMTGDATITNTGALTVTHINGIVPGGACGGGQFVTLISASGVPTCATPAGAYPGGAPPQLTGFSAANVGEAETISGDATLTRAGANSYTIAVTRTAGTLFGPLATATTPLSIANGGRGTGTAPTAGQLSIAQSATAFGSVTMSGDATITQAGVITVTRANGTVFGPLATAPTPLSIANGGTGTATAPTTPGQFMVAQSTTAYGPVTMSGDLTATLAGVVTVTRVNGVTPGGACTAGQFVTSVNASAVPACGGLPAASSVPGGAAPQLVGYATTNVPEAETIGGDATLARTSAGNYTITVARVNGVSGPFLPVNNPTATGVLTAPQMLVTATNNSLTFGPSVSSPFAQLFSTSAGSAHFSGGMHYNGTNWIADATYATDVGQYNGGIHLTANTGLTVGNPVTATDIAVISPTGLNIATGSISIPSGTIGIGTTAPAVSNMLYIVGNYNNNTSVTISNSTAGPAAYTTYYALNDLGHYGSIQLGSSQSGDGWVLQTNTANGITLDTFAASGTAPIHLAIGPTTILAVATTGVSVTGSLSSTGTVFANTPATPTSGSLNSAANGLTVPNGTQGPMAGACSGLFSVVDQTSSGQSAVYMCGGANCHMAGNSGGTVWVQSTTAPPAGNASVMWNGSNYAIYNNQGQSVTYGVTSLCGRNA